MDAISLRTVSALIAARNAVDWTQEQWAKKSRVAMVSIARIEAGITSPRQSTLGAMKGSLAKAGVKILEDIPAGGYTIHAERKAVGRFAGSLIPALMAARHALGWTQPTLAERSRVAINTIAKMESKLSVPTENTLTSLRRAVERNGVTINTDQPFEGFSLEVHPAALRVFRLQKARSGARKKDRSRSLA